MIEVANINGKPETIPPNVIGHLFDGQKFIFFESEEERNDYFNSLLVVWDKESYCNKIKQEINNIVSSKLVELDYTDFQENASIGDVLNSATNSLNQWHQEALIVREWYDNIYALRDEYLNNVTEETIDNNFIENLPKFNYEN